MNVKEVTCSAPVNIAVIKYWGKRDSKLILPTNSSLSLTLDQSDLRSTTTARLLRDDSSIVKDVLILNGSKQTILPDSRLGNCLRRIREIRAEQEQISTNKDSSSELPESRRAVLIASENNFPTAAGLASSASGFAAVSFALSKLLELEINLSDLSKIARQGSGSACRSIFGGFVIWNMGEELNGSDSFATQVSPQSDWPDLQALICVVDDSKKSTSSTNGMDSTVRTSTLLSHRAKVVVPDRIQKIKRAILDKDFDTFASITMADSNQFHAVCLDTSPPIFYLNDISRSIISVIEELNRSSRAEGKGYLAAYTFDAGPNAVIYAPKKNMEKVINLIIRYFPLPDSSPFEDPKNILSNKSLEKLDLPHGFNERVTQVWSRGSVSRLIHTQVGDGPRLLNSELGKGLLDSSGQPQPLPPSYKN
ncbi:diphosphomevalonate decarboxylase [Phakopsora pachyrhizi]|uniref:Diphosphomevalonate decarboxylase n=1 Tax=Phakopsora pachyrhizi TaxID=170000 RepID=A0AAV0APT1_PHAPC|nr:diphosphomevalonate decarboxylase [Phakopsora pachyrhizi]CAH7670426.1 diphosphomevalonate decarboxylase [Phakopsora pachyrhizi]